MAAVVLTGMLLVPVFISVAGRDSFRIPKELLVRAEAIVIVAIGVALLSLRQIRRALTPPFSRSDVVAAAIVLWTVVTTLTSTNRRLSAETLLWVCCCAVVFLATRFVAGHRGIVIALALALPAVVNSLVVILQVLDRFSILQTPRGTITGLLGNPNDVGSFLAAAIVAEVTLSVVDRRWRILHLGLVAACTAGLVAARAVTAISALCAGLIALAFVINKRRTLIALAVGGVLALCVVLVDRPLREAAVHRTSLARLDAVLSGRLGAFAAAWEMIKRHPVIGVGPGCFGWQYFPHKLYAEANFPSVLHPVQFDAEGIQRFPTLPRTVNFAEVHNDHLQTAAVSGIPGYILFLAAVGVLAAKAKIRERAASATTEGRFAELLAIPLAVTFFVLTLAQFPLELAAPSAAFLFLSALCDAWSGA